MSTPPEPVTIAVVTWNSADVLPGLVASLPAGAGDVPWHLVVVDNDSTDDTVAVAQRLCPEATSCRRDATPATRQGSTPPSPPPRRRRRCSCSTPTYASSRAACPRWWRRSTCPGTGIAVPRLIDGDGELIHSMRRRPDPPAGLRRRLRRCHPRRPVVGDRRAGQRSRRATPSDATPDWAEGSTQLVSRACLDACGPWDESYFLYSEETEFHLRSGAQASASATWPTRAPSTSRATPATSPRLWALLTANRLRLFSRLASRPQTALYWLALVLRESSRAARGDAIARAAVRVLVRPDLLRAPRGPAWLDLATPNPVLRPGAVRAEAARP